MIHKIIEDNIAVLTFETGKGNAFSKLDLLELSRKLSDIESDISIVGIVLTGSNRTFSIGGSIDSILNLKSDAEISDFFKIMDSLLIQLFSFRKPVVAALNGHSIGLGFLVAQCADYAITVKSDKIKIGLPEIKIGMTIDAIMCEILSFNNINGKRLAEIIYTGELYNINQALELGLINYIVSESELIPKSKSTIQDLIHDNPKVFAINKNVLRENSLRIMKKNFEERKYSIFKEVLRDKKTIEKLTNI